MIEAIKNNAQTILTEWVDGLINNVVSAHPRMAAIGAVALTALNNYIGNTISQTNAMLDRIAIFATRDGRLDADAIYDELMAALNELPETSFEKGFIRGTIGQGCVRILLPDGPIWAKFLDNQGAIKLTSEDFATLRDLIKASL